MNKTQEQLITELDAKIPRDAIASRQGGGASKLSYLEGWYVIDRLNKTIGQGNWAYTADAQVAHVDVENKSVHYTAKVRLAVKFPSGETTEFSDYGYGDGSDKYKIGKAHELAIKEAVTDGIKRCAKNLGMSLGLALYDKTQENVEEAPRAAAQAPKPAPAQTVAPSYETKELPPGALEIAGIDPKIAVAITSKSNVILAKAGAKGSPERAAKLAELKAGMKAKYGVEVTTELNDLQSRELLRSLEAEVIKLEAMANGV